MADPSSLQCRGLFLVIMSRKPSHHAAQVDGDMDADEAVLANITDPAGASFCPRPATEALSADVLLQRLQAMGYELPRSTLSHWIAALKRDPTCLDPAPKSAR